MTGSTTRRKLDKDDEVDVRMTRMDKIRNEHITGTTTRAAQASKKITEKPLKMADPSCHVMRMKEDSGAY